MKRKIVLTFLTIILLINTIFGVINVHKLLSTYYPIENYKIINTMLDDYSNILAIENATSDEIVFFCSQYWVQDEVYDDWSAGAYCGVGCEQCYASECYRRCEILPFA